MVNTQEHYFIQLNPSYPTGICEKESPCLPFKEGVFHIPYRSISSLFTSPVVPFWTCSSLLMSLLKYRVKDGVETISQDLKYSPYAVFPAIPDQNYWV